MGNGQRAMIIEQIQSEDATNYFTAEQVDEWIESFLAIGITMDTVIAVAGIAGLPYRFLDWFLSAITPWDRFNEDVQTIVKYLKETHQREVLLSGELFALRHPDATPSKPTPMGGR